MCLTQNALRGGGLYPPLGGWGLEPEAVDAQLCSGPPPGLQLPRLRNQVFRASLRFQKCFNYKRDSEAWTHNDDTLSEGTRHSTQLHVHVSVCTRVHVSTRVCARAHTQIVFRSESGTTTYALRFLQEESRHLIRTCAEMDAHPFP